jgi:hypothetical protein
MVERTTPKEPIELAWDEYVASMEGRLHGQTDAFKFAWKAAQRTWVGLTDDDIWDAFGGRIGTSNSDVNPIRLLADARKIEAKLKEKNNA